jgi:hypothetical protein
MSVSLVYPLLFYKTTGFSGSAGFVTSDSGASAGCCALKGGGGTSKNLIRIPGNSTLALFI